ncbi:MAG: hypothetical protein N3E51_03435 [Candidatus Micrarchaeota archaeon]|nr:hypothetical protein [Candidatus Micrarchaeota archaeon]
MALEQLVLSTPHYDRLEQAHYLDRRGFYRQAWKQRFEWGVRLKKAKKGDVAFLHTHVLLEPAKDANACLPSSEDIAHSAKNAAKRGVRHYNIACIDVDGKIIGVFEYEVDGKLWELLDWSCGKPDAREIMRAVESRITMDTISLLEKKGLLRWRAVPASGYKFSIRRGMFVPSEE